MQKLYLIFKKNPLPKKKPKILSRYHNSLTNFKFQHKPKYHLSKNPHMKIDLLFITNVPKSIKLLYSIIMNLNTINISFLPW